MPTSFDITMNPIPDADHIHGGDTVNIGGTYQGVVSTEIGLTPEGGAEFKIADATLNGAGGWTAEFEAPAGDLTITYEVRAAGDSLADPKAGTTRPITVLAVA